MKSKEDLLEQAIKEVKILFDLGLIPESEYQDRLKDNQEYFKNLK